MDVSTSSSLYETALSHMWFEEDGVFCTKTKKGVAITRNNLQDTFNYIRLNAGAKKICWLGDVSEASPPTKEAQEFAAKETPNIIKALALVTRSRLSKMIANIFLLVKSPPYPVRMFNDEQEARKWLRKYLTSKG
jgi:hypothetical protein